MIIYAIVCSVNKMTFNIYGLTAVEATPYVKGNKNKPQRAWPQLFFERSVFFTCGMLADPNMKINTPVRLVVQAHACKNK
jgi:hypothetical protein